MNIQKLTQSRINYQLLKDVGIITLPILFWIADAGWKIIISLLK